MTRNVDFSLHGIVRIRLLDARLSDTMAVARQLGLATSTFRDRPDIVIRFVDRIALRSPLRYLGLDDAGFTDDAFLVLRGKQKSRVQVQVPLDDVGQHCEIVCERGCPAVPLLIPILNLTAVRKGFVPLHASAFVFRGKGILTTGWSKGGKTEALLAFMTRGAQYVGDEWVYVSPGGETLHGIPEPIRMWDWHLAQLPRYRARIPFRDRIRLGLLGPFNRLCDRVTANRWGRHLPAARLVRRAVPILKRQQFVDMPPARLFAPDRFATQAPLDRIFFVASHEGPEITLEPADPLEIAGRMVFSLQEERSDLVSHYMKFRFAFPERRNQCIETAAQRERELLTAAFEGKPAFAVYHPYPVSLGALFESMRPHCEMDDSAAPDRAASGSAPGVGSSLLVPEQSHETCLQSH